MRKGPLRILAIQSCIFFAIACALSYGYSYEKEKISGIKQLSDRATASEKTYTEKQKQKPIFEPTATPLLDRAGSKKYNKRIVVLDAGHGGKDTGTETLFGAWYEKDYNLDFVKRIKELWTDEDGMLYLTRWDDSTVSLSQRVEFANKMKADAFISIHCNSTDESSGTGLEMLYKTDSYKTESKHLAKLFQSRLAKLTGFENRDLIDGNSIYIIRKSNMPTVLLEMGFMTDRRDLTYLSKEKNREEMSKVVYQVIKEEVGK